MFKYPIRDCSNDINFKQLINKKLIDYKELVWKKI